MPVLETSWIVLILAAVSGYFLGSIPFGIVFARLFGLGDLRQIGSGNIGATNVLRTGSKPAAFLTLVFDAGKGAIALLIARFLIGEDAAQVAGLFAFLGHLFPVWLKFEGGKGVATLLGTLLALSFPLGAAACLGWLAAALIFRISSLSALISGAVAIGFTLIYLPSAIIVTAIMVGLMWKRHKENIIRILNGTEPKIGT